MSLATDGFSAMINALPMAWDSRVYQSSENPRTFFLSSAGNVAEKTLEVKAGKNFGGCGWLVVGCGWAASGPDRDANRQPRVSSRIEAIGVAAEVTRRKCSSSPESASSRRRLPFFNTP